MEEIIFEFSQDDNELIEKYLLQSIINYGLSQHSNEVSIKFFCSCFDEKDSLIGAVMGTKTLNLLFVSHIFVEEKFRNRGIGSQLLINIERQAKKAGCNIIRLNTFNKLSHSFYTNNGFNQSVVITDYMTGFDLLYYDKNIG